MLDQPLFDKLVQLRLGGMKEALKEQMSSTKYDDLSFEERLGLLIDYEVIQRENRRLNRRMKSARFRETGRIADLDMSARRGIDKRQILSLAQCIWIKEHLNIIITGATGVGKTYLASALGYCACEKGFSVRYYKTSRLLHEIKNSYADGSWGKLLEQIAKYRCINFR
jgi:DNA replication protein DnaC